MAWNSDFKIGDVVKLTKEAEMLLSKKETFEIAAIYSDWLGSVALKTIDGYGYGFQYLEKVSNE